MQSKKSIMCFIDGQWDFSRAGRKSISHVESKNGAQIFCDCQPCFQAGSQAKRLQRNILTTSSHKSHCVWCQPTQNTHYSQPFQRELSPSKERVRGTPEQHNLFPRAAFFRTNLHFRHLQNWPANLMGIILATSQVEKADKGVPEPAFPHSQINQNEIFSGGWTTSENQVVWGQIVFWIFLLL